jgi:hypothetical protein
MLCDAPRNKWGHLLNDASDFNSIFQMMYLNTGEIFNAFAGQTDAGLPLCPGKELQNERGVR